MGLVHDYSFNYRTFTRTIQGKFSYFFDIEIARYFYLPDTQTSDDPKCEESKWISKPEFSGQARGFWGKTSDRTITGEDQSHSKRTTSIYRPIRRRNSPDTLNTEHAFKQKTDRTVAKAKLTTKVLPILSSKVCHFGASLFTLIIVLR